MGKRVGRIEVLIRTVRPGDFVHESLGGGVVRLRIIGSDGDRANHDLGAIGPSRSTFSGATLSVMTKTHLYPRWAATIARPTPVLPDVGSTIVPPG